MPLTSRFKGALALCLSLATALPAVAAPMPFTSAPRAAALSDVVPVQETRRERRAERRAERRERRAERRFERRGNRAYLNGRRGYRERRPGYRLYNGYWFPAAAFTISVIIDSRPAVRLSSAHFRWCENRWRSYRASDNTYQPSSGPRRTCVSPYS